MDKFELNKQITMAKCMTVFDSDRLENELTETSIIIHACMLIRQLGSNEAEDNFSFEKMEEDDSYRSSDSQGFFRPKMIWLRKHYPLYLGCASLNKYIGDTAKIQDEIWKCREIEILVLAPDINHSASECMPEAGKVRMGLASICGLSQSSIEHIIQVREALGKNQQNNQNLKIFYSLKVFLLHIDLEIVTKREIDLLIKAGAFRSMLNNPAATIDNLTCLIKEVKQSGIISNERTISVWTKQEEIEAEYEALGCHVSRHPLACFIPSFFKNSFEHIGTSPEWERHTRFARVAAINELKQVNASGETTFASIMFDDPFCRTNVLVTSETYPRVQAAIQLNNLLLIEVQAYRLAGDTIYLLTDAFKLERPLPDIKPEHLNFGYVTYQTEKQFAEAIITTTVKHINQQSNAPGMESFDSTAIPLDDPDTYHYLVIAKENPFALLAQENNCLLKTLKPDNFEDLLIAVRLSSPVLSSAGITDTYLACAQGEKEPSFLIPELKPFLESTYGTPIYQESFQDIVEHLASFSPAESKAFHQTLCVKRTSDLLTMRTQLKQGLGNLMTEDEADNFFDWLEYHAGMLMKKSTLAEPVLIAYQQAWLKIYHPEAYSLAVTEQQPTTIRM